MYIYTYMYIYAYTVRDSLMVKALKKSGFFCERILKVYVYIHICLYTYIHTYMYMKRDFYVCING